MSGGHSTARRWLWLASALAGAAPSACVTVTYPVPGQHVSPRAGETLVFGRLHFFYDGREFFPWKVRLLPDSGLERHLWLLRLDERAVSAELRPDEDGSLAIWLAPGDYALLGSTQAVTPGAAAVEVEALLRVPARPGAAYAGDLVMKTEWQEGTHVSFGEFGAKTVEEQPLEIARSTLEQKLGTLPQAPVISPWCTADHLPAFNVPELANCARELLDRGCPPDSEPAAAHVPRTIVAARSSSAAGQSSRRRGSRRGGGCQERAHTASC